MSSAQLFCHSIIQFLLYFWLRDVAIDKGVFEVAAISHSRLFEEIKSADSVKACHFKAAAQASCTAEKVDKGQLGVSGIVPIGADIRPVDIIGGGGVLARSGFSFRHIRRQVEKQKLRIVGSFVSGL